jgi:hypothetical protein
VFADLGMPNSEQELLKAELTVQIFKLVSECKLIQSNAAELSRYYPGSSVCPDALPTCLDLDRPANGFFDDSRSGCRTLKPASTRTTRHMSVVVQSG